MRSSRIRTAFFLPLASFLGLAAAAARVPAAEPAAPTAPKPPAAPATPHVAAPAAPAAPTPATASPPAPAAPVATIAVTLTNPLATARPKEIVSLTRAELIKIVPGLDLKKALILDGHGAPVLSQLVDQDGDDTPDEIVFQSDFAAREAKTFKVALGIRHLAAPSDYKVYGRFVRERHDDFAWENDRVAHRVYGPDLETFKKEPLTSSGVDTWVKRVPKLVVNEWYMTDDYHQDHGEGADFYAVGKSRGCGGIGVWTGGALAVSRNFVMSRVLANGPLRLIFELTYAPWDAGAAKVAETKRVILDAGTSFNRIESTFAVQGSVEAGKSALPVAIGVAKHPGHEQKADAKGGWMGVWEPLDGGKSGHLGCAVLLPPGVKGDVQQTTAEYLLVTPAPPRGPLVYYVGSAWDQSSGAPTDLAGWAKEGQALEARLAAPIKVKLAPAHASH